MLVDIEQVLDERVRPVLRSRGGDIEVLSLSDDGVLATTDMIAGHLLVGWRHTAEARAVTDYGRTRL